jgi:rhodanese-related sulfurtransferase
MKTLCYIVLFFGATTSLAQQTLEQVLLKYNKQSIPYISAEMLIDIKNDPTIVLLDSREKKEYEVSHIKGALYAGYEDFNLQEVSKNIKSIDTPIIVYCSLGVRSEDIAETLEKAGYTNIKNLYGGIFNWKNNNLPVVNRHQKPTDSMHVYSKKWGKWLTKGIKVINK